MPFANYTLKTGGKTKAEAVKSSALTEACFHLAVQCPCTRCCGTVVILERIMLDQDA